MTTCTTIHLPTVLHFHPGSLATNQHFNMKLLTLSKSWCLFESTSTQGLICHIKEWHRVSWVDSTAKGTRLNGRRKYTFWGKYPVFYLYVTLTICAKCNGKIYWFKRHHLIYTRTFLRTSQSSVNHIFHTKKSIAKEVFFQTVVSE